mgnify:FL=1
MTDLLTDSQGRTWHALEREGGSVVLYYTREGSVAHFVVWDSLDDVDNSRNAKKRIEKLHDEVDRLTRDLGEIYDHSDTTRGIRNICEAALGI